MHLSHLPSSPRWRLRGDTRCVGVATKAPRSNHQTLAGETADDSRLGLAEARGAGSFNVHEHVVVAPSHLIFFNLAISLTQQMYNALSVLQRDDCVMNMRSCSQHAPLQTVLKAFEHKKMGGTALSSPTMLFISLLLRQCWMKCTQKPCYQHWQRLFLWRSKLYVTLRTRCSSDQQFGTMGNMPSATSQPFKLCSCWDVLCIPRSAPSQGKGSIGKSQACTDSSSFSIGPCRWCKLGQPYASCSSISLSKSQTEQSRGETVKILLDSQCRDGAMLRCFPESLPLQRSTEFHRRG